MPSPRFLAVLLVIGSLPALAQAQHSSHSTPNACRASQESQDNRPDAQLQDPLKQDSDSTSSAVLNARALSILDGMDKGIRISVDDPNAVEHRCFKLRMYVVAPDSKGSDSVHPVRYTTCQPSSQYGLKTTVERKIERPGASQPVTLQY